MRPFLSFYGAKWRDTFNYPAPTHPLIVEPFAGSAGYALRYHWHQVVLCDIDPIIASVWQYLIDASPEEILAIPDVPLDGSSRKEVKRSDFLVYIDVGRNYTRCRRFPQVLRGHDVV